MLFRSIILAMVAAASSIVSVTTYGQLAVRSRLAYLPWAGALLEVIIIGWRHDTAVAIAVGSAVAVGVTIAATVIPLLRRGSSVACTSVESEPQASGVTVGA